MKRSRERLKSDIRWGIGKGLILAVAFGLFVIALTVIKGEKSLEDHLDVTLGGLLSVYFGTAFVGGTIAGILRPWFAHMWGAALGGFLIGSLGGLGVQVIFAIRDGQWDRWNVFAALIYGATVGVGVGIAWFRRFSKSAEDDLDTRERTRQQRRHGQNGSADPG